MSSTAPSLRDLAKTLGLSHTTVSEALRNNPRVKPETRQRVHAAAKAAGYQYNPLAGALMSEMRRSRATTFRGVIAIVDLDGPAGRAPSSARYHRELTKGAIERAEELGFKAEVFIVGHEGMTPQRLDTILQSRGIRGVFLLPVSDNPDLTKINWSRYASIYTDYVIEQPALHNICPNHYRAMLMALHRLQSLGYKRPGLVIQQHHDERLFHRWEAAYQIYQHHYNNNATKVPSLLSREINRADFSKWFKKYKPDVVLCHRAEVLDWMRECGAKVPQSHGFCCLNTMMNPDVACAGLDLQPRLLGTRGIELVIGQLYRNECGVPELRTTTTVPAQWVDGPTVRDLKKK
ncbi:LacI family DNA-binding transcriptional regulator [Ereboglobus luteus]|uniref:LacI family transcriptional regulator n=1 Tax=Ereboglobus luteus TaxID=1796921 RepID=A0A2U8E6L8_9BACT|nr:LacI family DNA-binding transcriptional regulator [Ereboglobus luteus]AWI10405.1 LacI family transcriptional regulator [Ereboglobus luteus]